LTLIETTKGFIFGGFTPLVWDSSDRYKSDSSQKGFLFTLKNSRNSEPRKFKLTSGSAYAIGCDSTYGPTFGYGCDICVADNCNANTSSYTHFGTAYVNDTGIDGKAVFTGESNFTVKEIEVFAITL
jgi:hypothetical protein